MVDPIRRKMLATGAAATAMAAAPRVFAQQAGQPPELKARTINRVRTFLKAHQPVTAAR